MHPGPASPWDYQSLEMERLTEVERLTRDVVNYAFSVRRDSNVLDLNALLYGQNA